MKTRLFTAWLAAGALTLFAGAAEAQFRASLTGTVTDTKGGIIPDAQVTLTDVDTNHVLKVTTNGSGVYSFNALPPDHFSLLATSAGFKTTTLTNVTITPEQANNIDLKLSPGEVTTSVEVDADAVAQLETATATISGTITENQIQHLPSASRDVFQLVQLAPGVFGDGAQSASNTQQQQTPGSSSPGTAARSTGIFTTENGPQANANGGQQETNGISIDGVSTVSAVWGGASVITPSEDSVGSVKVVSNGYDAENGRFSGAQIQVTSKTGTNDIHGSAFLRANRPGLNAYQRYNGTGTFNAGTPLERGLIRDATRSNQFGGSIGGPIWKNHLFAFFAYEGLRNNLSQIDTGWYETAQFRALAPTGFVSNTYMNFPGAAPAGATLIDHVCSDIGLVEGTSCHAIPGAGLNLGSPLTSARGTQDTTWVSATSPGVGSGLTNVPDIAQYSTTNPTQISGDQYNGRLDADATKKDHLAFAIYWVPSSKTTFTGSDRSYNLYHHNQINDAYSIIWNHTFSSSFLNEARANDAGWRWNEVADNPQEPFGLPTSTVDMIGSINLTNFGAPGPSVFNQHTYSYKDVATKVLHNQTVKFGGELTRLYFLSDPTYSARPAYNFYNIWAFLNDAPHSESGSFDPATGTPTTNRQDDREDLWGAFVQDDWKLTPNFTVNLGLRYDYFGPLSSKQNNIGVVQFGSGADAFTNLNIRQGGNLTTQQKDNFGPQVGFAWSPSISAQKVVFRGGYGLNFNQNELAITTNGAGNPPSVLPANYTKSSIIGGVSSIDPRIVYAVASDSHSLFGYPANPNAIGGLNSANIPTGGGTFLTGFQSNPKTIYTEHYSLDMQVQLAYQTVFTLGYQGNQTRHLLIQSRAYATAFPQGFAQNPLVTDVGTYNNNGSGNSNEMLVGLKHNFSHQFMFDAEYQWQKSMDTGSTPYYEDPYPYNTKLAYGRSDYNVGSAFKVYGMWQPVFFRSKPLLHAIVDGWNISGIYNVHGGYPFTPTFSTGNEVYYTGSGYTSLRPAAYNGGGGHAHNNNAFEQGRANVNFPLAGPTGPYFTDPATGIPASGGAYALPQLPGIERNSFTGPGYQDVDATLSKNFALPHIRGIGNNAGLEIRADAFNLFNETNLVPGSVNTNYQQATFGQASQGLSGRIINLQARFSF